MNDSVHVSINDSLAKGMVHQIGRDHQSHQEARRAKLERMTLPTHSRNQAYRTAVTYFRSLFDDALTREYETGANKKTVWHGVHVTLLPDGYFFRSYCHIPFKDTSKIELGSDPFMCSQHAHQRLIQIYGLDEPGLRYGTWLAHSYALTRALSQAGMLDSREEVKTHGYGEVMVWRSFDTPDGIHWISTTVIGSEVMTGSNLRAHHRLVKGLPVEGRLFVSEEEYRYCLSARLLKKAMSLTSDKSTSAARLN